MSTRDPAQTPEIARATSAALRSCWNAHVVRALQLGTAMLPRRQFESTTSELDDSAFGDEPKSETKLQKARERDGESELPQLNVIVLPVPRRSDRPKV